MLAFPAKAAWNITTISEPCPLRRHHTSHRQGRSDASPFKGQVLIRLVMNTAGSFNGSLSLFTKVYKVASQLLFDPKHDWLR